jgi:hypothetical protein
MQLLLCASIVLATACPTPKGGDLDLKAELEAMFESDQFQRLKMDEIGKRYGYDSAEMKAVWEKQRLIDEANIARLVEIIAAHGWPGRTLVGEKGSLAAFLVLQHADYSYQKIYLPLVRKAVAAGELRPGNLALLEDRVLMREGKKQIFGTQLRSNDKGALEFWPIEDEPNVDQRRKDVGLPPLAEYAKLFGLEYPQK